MLRKVQKISPFVVFASLFALFLPFATRGFDYHHHGLVLATARRITNGEVLYRDVWSQYGPIPTYLQALVLRLFGVELVHLQVLTSIVLALSGTLMFKVWMHIYSGWTPVASVVIWAATSYFFDWRYSMLPWSSDFSLMFLCLAFYLLVSNSILQFEVINKRLFCGMSFRFLVAGVSLGLSAWCRLNSGVIVVVFVVLILVLLGKFIPAFSIVAGFFICGLLGLTILGFFGAADDFVEQTIVWPSRWAQEIASPNAIQLINYGLVFIAFPTIVFFIGIHKLLSNGRLAKLVIIFCCVIVIAVLRQLRYYQPTNSAYWSSESNRFAIFGISSIHVLWAFVLFSVGVACWWLSTNSKEVSQTQFSVHDDTLVFIRFAPVGFLFGIYPVPDRAHIWWVILPAIGGCIHLVLETIQGRIRKLVFLSIGSAFLASSFVVEVKDNFSRTDLKRWNDGTPWDGMLEREDSQLIRREQVLSIVSIQNQFGPKAVLTVCQDPMYSTIGENDFPDAYLIYWGPIGRTGYLPSDPLNLERVSWIRKNKPIIFVCPPVRLEIENLDFDQIGYEVYREWTASNGGEWGWPLGGAILVPHEWLVK